MYYIGILFWGVKEIQTDVSRSMEEDRSDWCLKEQMV